MKKKTIAALAAGGALLLAAAVIGVLSLAKGYFILTPPTHIQLNGPSEERIAAFAAYTDPGAQLLRGGNRTDTAVTVEGRVNTEVPGDYTLTYQAEYRGQRYTARRLVRVEDREAPELTLAGDTEVTVSRFDLFQDPGAAARDRCDGDLTASIRVTDQESGDIHVLTYTVTDKAGNTATATRQVSVYENTATGSSPVYLTFDDGPSDRVTPRVLDTLKAYNVRATFFIVNYGESGKALIRRMIDEGHTVAIHGYSHDYASIYKSDEAFMQNVYRLRDRLRADFGYEATILRFPGGSSNTVSRQYSVGIMSRLAQRVQNEGFTYFDWNVSSGDAAGTPASSGRIYSAVTSALRHGRSNVVLMHDAGTKSTTADALPDIIQYCLANGYSIQAITPATKPVHHGIAN